MEALGARRRKALACRHQRAASACRQEVICAANRPCRHHQLYYIVQHEGKRRIGARKNKHKHENARKVICILVIRNLR